MTFAPISVTSRSLVPRPWASNGSPSSQRLFVTTLPRSATPVPSGRPAFRLTQNSRNLSGSPSNARRIIRPSIFSSVIFTLPVRSLGSGSVWVVLSTSYWTGERESISFAPWLQPGGQVLQMIPEPFTTVSRDTPANKKPLETFLLNFRFAKHRAEAAVLMRSLRVPAPALSVKAVTHGHLLEISNRPATFRYRLLTTTLRPVAMNFNFDLFYTAVIVN